MDAAAWLAGWRGHGGPWGHMDGWGPGGWTWLWVSLLVIGVVLLVVLGVLALTRGSSGARGERHDRAREILTERYARGEIDTEEYHERLRELSRS